jgi:hypothetical protein
MKFASVARVCRVSVRFESKDGWRLRRVDKAPTDATRLEAAE